MNYKVSGYILGIAAIAESIFMAICLIIGLAYRENTILGFGIAIVSLLAFGLPLAIKKPENISMNAKGGLITVALIWIMASLFGTIPLIVSKEIPNFVDAFFEMASGFTTTGATIVNDMEKLSYSIVFWRSLTHWIGGMGILVFVIALLPKADAQIVHLFRAESPGPQVGKLVSKLGFTARILYGIYIAITIILVILLKIGNMNWFDSVLHAMSTVSTGGFSNKNASIGHYGSIYIEIIIAIFMFISAINFNLFYLILTGRVRQALKSEELKLFILILMIAFAFTSILLTVTNIYKTFGESARYSFFTVISIMTTTGFLSVNFSQWPVAAQIVLLIISAIGGCAGSTAGGLKVSRILILFRASKNEIGNAINRRALKTVKIDKIAFDNELVLGTVKYFMIYVFLIIFSVLLISIGNSSENFHNDFVRNITSVLTCINNTGPGLGTLSDGNFAKFSFFSKIILSFDMIAGRLEIMPMLLLFSPKAWK